MKLREPKVAYVSNVTGEWITAGEATDAQYWVRHLRQTVRFADGLGQLLKEENAVLLEVGPGNILSRLARGHSEIKSTHAVVSTLAEAKRPNSEAATVINALGHLWLAGVEIDWAGYYGSEQRRRLPLPTYPFERQRFWIEAQPLPGERGARQTTAHRKTDPADWFYVPAWKQSALPSARATGEPVSQPSKWLVFGDESGVDASLAERLRRQGHDVVVALPAANFGKRSRGVYQLHPSRAEDYVALFADLERDERMPDNIAHLWSLTADEPRASRIEMFEQVQERGFYSLLRLAQALGKQNLTRPLQIHVVSNNVQDVTGTESLCPEKATILGPCKVFAKEYPNISCSHVDVVRPAPGSAPEQRLLDQLMAEFEAKPMQALVAFRGHHRWVQTFEQLRFEAEPQQGATPLREGGVYLITGGLGTIGLTLAGQLARATRCKLILNGRSAFPARDEWAGWLANHGDEDATGVKIRKIRALEELGAEVLLARADVALEGEMREALTQAEKQFGKINGVIHAAGIAGGGMMQLKTAEAVGEVFAPKVLGTLVLESLLKNTKLDFFICCSSALSIIGPLGQVDYCAANAFLDAYAHDKATSGGALTISINWDAWGEAGMAVEAAPANRGARPEQTFAEGESLDHPLFDTRAVEPEGGDTCVTQFSVGEHWVLDEHRIMGRPVVPGTAYLEMAHAAFRQYATGQAVELRDVLFLSPLTLGEQEKKEVRTIIERNGSSWNFRIVSKSGAGEGSLAPSWREHATGKLFVATVEPPKQFDLDAAARACNHRHIDLTVENSPDEHDGQMALGPRWNSLKQLSAGANEFLGLLELPAEFAADLEKFELHPALMDVATGIAARRIEEGFYLPLSYQRVRVRAPLPGRIFAHVKPSANNRAGGETLAFNISLLDEQGITLVEIEDFILRRVDGAAAKARAEAAQTAAREPASNHKQAGVSAVAGSDHAGAQTRDEIKSIPGGISLKEGAEAFARILSGGGLPQVIVTPRDLHALIERADALTQTSLLEKLETEQTPKHLHPRPALQTPFVAPTNEIEERLADIWQKLLGIEQVGIHDNFFELGGHSLLTLQVMSRLRDAFQVELPMRDVFEIPTIAELSKAVETNIMNKIIEKISGLTDEEAQLALQETPTS
ncbi:MAG TPA: SDR family NAD(P)-dependent oxidoreductase [Pyrinomonadaceae bacterium]